MDGEIVVTTEWVINMLLAFIVGLIAGRLLKTIVWLAVIVIIAFVLIQFFYVTPAINFDSAQLQEIGNNVIEWFKEIFENFKATLVVNSPMFLSFLAGFVISFIVGGRK